MVRVTLQNRIIVILTIFTVVTIVTFVAIQLQHELDTINQYNTNKAMIIASVVQERLELIFSSPEPLERKISLFEKTILPLKESRLIEKAYLLNKEGTIISSTERQLNQKKGDHHDLNLINNIDKGLPSNEEIFIDHPARLFSLYLPFKHEAELYVARIFFSLGYLGVAIQQVYTPGMILGILLTLINVVLGITLSRLIVKPIKVFNEASKEIASGRLDLKVKVATNDELQELADTFNLMTQELVKMKERAENANPLTKLPGNIVIREEVENRIRNGQKFTVIYCDLDNFKAFNDKYGIHKGDEAIRLAGNIFKEAIKQKGNLHDFIGHEGGDDFIIVTTPQCTEGITNYVISEFDKRVRSLYNNEDLEKGYIVATARDGRIEQFPIMTISLSGVTNEYRSLSSYAEVTNIAAELKKKAKREKRSCFVLDKRRE